MSDDPRLVALRGTTKKLLGAALDDPELAERALRRLRADPKLVHLVDMPPGLKRTGRRPPARFDPLKAANEAGLDGLRAQLGDLDLEELRNIVAQYGMDPRRLVMRWKDVDRVRAHIESTTAQRSRKGDAFRTPDVGAPTERQQVLMRAFVRAWELSSPAPAHQPFDLGSLPLEHPNWPDSVPVPSREEVRPLVHLGLLDTDRRAAPIWRVFPSELGRSTFGDPADDEAVALSDPDRRLGLILEATVGAFEADPTQPIHFAPMDQINYVSHPHWPLQPDAVKSHDLDQLEQLGLIATRPRGQDTSFWPTPSARAATKDVAGYLDQLAGAAHGAEQSRLSKWAERLRAGDLAVGAVAGTASGALIRALTGF